MVWQELGEAMSREPDQSLRRLRHDALAYLERGFSVVPISAGTKRPTIKWGEFVKRLPTEDEINELFGPGNGVGGVAVIAGPISHRLAIRDFDRTEAYKRFCDDHPKLSKELPTVQTKRGFHLYCESDHHKIVNLGDGEFRGAGYSIAPHTLHPSGHVYDWIIPLPDGDLPFVDHSLFCGDTVSESSESIRDYQKPFSEFSAISETTTVNELIRATTPTKSGERNLKLLALARGLKFNIEETKGKSAQSLKSFVRRWHQAALPVIATANLEWPIVIPINSTTTLWSDMTFLYRRSDDSVHFKVFGFPNLDFEAVSQEETVAVRRERVRLWYVALTRARDLLLLPKQTERIADDWLSLINLDIGALPLFDATRFLGVASQSVSSSGNRQDDATWQQEATTIAAAERRISWHQPSRHDQPLVPIVAPDKVFVGAESIIVSVPAANEDLNIQGGRERGLVLHKLMEEVLTGETADDVATLQARASELLIQMGLPDAEDAATGLSSLEMATAIQRTLQLPDIAELRPRLLPEFRVYAASVVGQTASLTAGIADAVAYVGEQIQTVVDWKSDVNPTPADIEMYRDQVRSYLKATGAVLGLIVFVTSGSIERVQSSA
jgi:hypothetical protein